MIGCSASPVILTAAARARLKTMETPADLKELERELENVLKEKESAVSAQEFEKAAGLRDEERRVSDELEEKRANWLIRRNQEEPVLVGEDIATIVSEWTGIPVVQLTEEETARLLRMEEELHRRMVGQEEAVNAVSRAVRRARSGLKDPKRPVGSFLFMGPTGVGKTEMAKALAAFLFGSEEAMIRYDMSEYMERHEVSKLIGAPPGYVGYEEGGKLTEAVRRRPYAVLLFDEIEKAHPDVFNLLLQIMEDGRLTDGQGHTVDFRNAVIIMTSNVGARDLAKGQGLGFAAEKGLSEGDHQKAKERVIEAMKQAFRPEFLNRIDDIVVFRSLSRQELLKIVDLMLTEVTERVKERGIDISVSQEARDFLLEKGYDPKYGARPLRRTIQRMVEDRLADLFLEGRFKEGARVGIEPGEDQLAFTEIPS